MMKKEEILEEEMKKSRTQINENMKWRSNNMKKMRKNSILLLVKLSETNKDKLGIYKKTKITSWAFFLL